MIPSTASGSDNSHALLVMSACRYYETADMLTDHANAERGMTDTESFYCYCGYSHRIFFIICSYTVAD
jgi:hypothetical protein